MTETHQLSDLQLAVMRALWEAGEATAAQVHRDLAASGRRLAPTTVSTLIARLEKRGLVTHRSEGRQYVYRARVEEGAVRRDMVERVTEQFFEGDVTALVGHLLRRNELSGEDLEQVRALIAEAEANEGDDQ
jgi:predicted transcriptional regulator